MPAHAGVKTPFNSSSENIRILYKAPNVKEIVLFPVFGVQTDDVKPVIKFTLSLIATENSVKV